MKLITAATLIALSTPALADGQNYDDFDYGSITEQNLTTAPGETVRVIQCVAPAEGKHLDMLSQYAMRRLKPGQQFGASEAVCDAWQLDRYIPASF